MFTSLWIRIIGAIPSTRLAGSTMCSVVMVSFSLFSILTTLLLYQKKLSQSFSITVTKSSAALTTCSRRAPLMGGSSTILTASSLVLTVFPTVLMACSSCTGKAYCIDQTHSIVIEGYPRNYNIYLLYLLRNKVGATLDRWEECGLWEQGCGSWKMPGR